MKKKERADLLLVEMGLCESRSQAQKLIMAGKVRIGSDHVIQKSSQTIPRDCDLNVKEDIPYVSRGALKLIPALKEINPEITGSICMDVGASTGGFTDLLLQNGAAKVYAIDCGYGQLHAKLRNDSRVVCMERTNARYLDEDSLDDKIDIMTADLSFISLTKILPACDKLLNNGAWVFTLIKPQFEAGKEEVGKGGVVRDPEIRQKCVDKILNFAKSELNWSSKCVIASPIKGPAGNQEYVGVFRKE